MISQDDIDAFRDIDDDREVIREGSRRYVKGLPEDRWHDGVNGHARFMRAARRLELAFGLVIDAAARMESEIRRTQGDSTEAFKDPMR